MKGENVPPAGIPESFKVLIKELQSLALDVKVLSESREEIIIGEDDEDDTPSLDVNMSGNEDMPVISASETEDEFGDAFEDDEFSEFDEFDSDEISDDGDSLLDDFDEKDDEPLPDDMEAPVLEAGDDLMDDDLNFDLDGVGRDENE